MKVGMLISNKNPNALCWLECNSSSQFLAYFEGRRSQPGLRGILYERDRDLLANSHVNQKQFFHGIFSDFWKRRGYAGTKNVLSIFGNVWIVFVNFRKVFGRFRMWEKRFHKGRPNKMFRFPSPSVLWKSVGRAKKKKNKTEKERKENRESS